jgi:hypothetical protein
MAASKAKAKPKTSSRSKSKPKSARSKPKKASGNAKRTAKAAGTGPRKSTQRKASGGGPLEKLKGPATATGAALLAVAGGLAATRNRNHRSALLHGGAGKKFIKNMKRVNLPSADEAIDWVEEKSKGVGDAGYKVAEMTSQARKAKKVVSR